MARDIEMPDAADARQEEEMQYGGISEAELNEK